MTALTFSLFGALTQAQQYRAWEIWHDPTEPDQFTYCLQDQQVVGRAPITGNFLSDEFSHGPAPMPAPDTVKSARIDPAPISTRDLLHELPPAMRSAPKQRKATRHGRRSRSAYTRLDMLRGLFLISVLVGVYAWIYLG